MKNFFFIFSLCVLLPVFCLAQGKTLFPITVNDKTGYIDKTGKIIIKPQFDDGWKFKEGLAPVLIGEDWGYIDETGKVVINPQFFEASDFSENLAPVGVYFDQRKIIDDKVGFYSYIDKTGKLITNQKFEVAFGFSEGLAQVLTSDYQHAFIDKTGNTLFHFNVYNNYFKDGFALFKTSGNMPDSRAGYIDKTGNIAIEAKFCSGEDFSEGLACVYSDKGAGFIDTQGRVTIDFSFTYCRNFSEGLAAVYLNDKWGFIDKTGKMVIQPQFAETEPFSDGAAVVRVIESSNASKKDERLIQKDKIIAVKEGLFGVIDKTGKLILPAKFTQIGNFSDGLAWLNLSGTYIVHGSTERWGYINKAGAIIWSSVKRSAR